MKRYVEMAREALTAALGRLNPRERRLVGIFSALAAVAFLYVGIIEPIVEQRTRMERRIETLSGDLAQLQALAGRIRRLEGELGQKTAPTNASKDFSLFSFIDKATSASVAADAVASMNPTRRRLPEGNEEHSVELRLQDIALGELVGLLRQIELADEPVYIKRLDLQRRYDDRTRFDATIIAGAVAAT